MRIPSLTLALFGSLAVLAAPLACSGVGERPPPGANGGSSGTGVFDSGGGGGGGGDSGDAGEQGEPADIAHASTICGTVACGIMGIRKSGFQELADVSFVVKDSAGKPVSGVQVKFELESPPQGTEFLGDSADGGTPSAGSSTVTIKTDATGKATARVQSGVTLGVFAVTASVNANLQAKSPAIGVRGVTPANRGFTLQCALKNLAAYADALPPKPLKTTCTATLVDRFNNPVGKPTTVNLKVEAGAIPSSVQSTAFNATGSNPDEGKASVEFSTVGTFPALDVPPLTGESSEQRPNQQIFNPRDGLVTVLAYVAGEEAFDDNNSNGQWDVGENFIDQGEPFVDSNDNNQWDPGEFYADVAPSNGQYDPPNEKWDKQTTIWTTTYVLYSGYMVRSEIIDPAVNVPVGATKKVYASFADDRFNPPQSGAVTTYTFARTGVRGGATAVFEPVLDGYGFALSRALYDATDPSVGCSATVARCQWLTKFSFGTPYTLGTTATLTGAAAAGTGETAELTFGATVHGVKVEHTSTAFFQ
jgi:hypothetical protein